MPRQNKVKTQDIVVLYTVQHLTTAEIGRVIGMSRMSVCKRLKNAGVTSDQGEWVKTTCSYCEKDVKNTRKRWKRNQNSYCNAECYYASIENPEYTPWRHGGRLARAIVSQYFHLQKDHVVHHKDSNQKNNALDNLAVYETQSDHLKAQHHNNQSVQPIWEGSLL